MSTITGRRTLFSGAALSLVLCGGAPAWAQAPTPGSNPLDDVVVTATRRNDTVSRIPLSITAVSQTTLDEQRVTSINDLVRAVPSIVFRQTGYDQSSTIAIRGVYTKDGSPTTGLYIDDTPISKRSFTSGGAGGANDAPHPSLFDLARIEVLRGPQGTLFGASAQGGAVRFIMPEPSLTDYSGKGMVGASVLKDGDESWEAGVAVGGPIVADKLGFRLSANAANQGGYLDHVSPYTNTTFDENTNGRETSAMRLAFAWQATEKLKISPSLYSGQEIRRDVDSWIQDVPGMQLNAGYFINRGTGATGLAYSYPTTYFPGGPFGPFDYGPYKTPIGRYDRGLEGRPATSPQKKYVYVPALKLEYAFEPFTVTSITSTVHDKVKAETWGQNSGTFNYALPLGTLNSANLGCFSSNPTTCVPVNGGPSGVGQSALNPFYPGFPDLFFHYQQQNVRDQLTQEIRFASSGESRLQWVGGLYYLNSRTVLKGFTGYNEAAMSMYYRGFNIVPIATGLTDLYRDGDGRCFEILIRACHRTDVNDVSGEGIYSMAYSRFYEEEMAAFGEINYMLTDKLKATAGVRYSRYEVDYAAYSVGSSVRAANAVAAGFVATPSHPYPILPGDPSYASVNSANLVEKPVTPKFSLSYQASEQNMYYVTAAKGYRGGGANNAGNNLRADCLAQLQAFGLSTVPTTYTSDSVWSYEGGAKMRLFDGRASINTSLFYIDWKEPQLSVRMPCGTSFITNAGHAVSKGADVEARFRVTDAFTVSGTVGYTNAQYTEDTVARDPNTGALSYTVHEGDTLPTPEIQVTLAFDYERPMWNDWMGRVHLDGQYAGRYKATVGPGGVGYNAALHYAAPTTFATASAGISKDDLDISFYVKNLANSQDLLSTLKGAGVPVMTYTFRPREIGFTVSRRF